MTICMACGHRDKRTQFLTTFEAIQQLTVCADRQSANERAVSCSQQRRMEVNDDRNAEQRQSVVTSDVQDVSTMQTFAARLRLLRLAACPDQ